MAIVDTLTGLHNRRYFNTNFAALMDQAARRGRGIVADDPRHRPISSSSMTRTATTPATRSCKIFAVAGSPRGAIASDLICRLGGRGVRRGDAGYVDCETAARDRRAVSAVTIDSGGLHVRRPASPPIAVTVSVGLAERNRGGRCRRADASRGRMRFIAFEGSRSQSCDRRHRRKPRDASSMASRESWSKRRFTVNEQMTAPAVRFRPLHF